jgi:hypothetical protein
MSDLVSKISASGLSAGVFLLWWPAHVTSQGGDVLLARGVLWAAAFELLLLGFRPLERAIGRAVREREPAVLAPSRIGRNLVFAVLAAAVPAVLLSGTHDVVSPARAAAPKVIVKREIVRREVVVRRVSHVVRVPVPVAATTQAKPTVATAAPAASVARRPATTAAVPTRSKATTTATPKPVATKAPADTKSDIPAATTTTATTAPAATSTAAQPATAAAQAPSAATPASASAAGAAPAGR